MKSPRLHAVGLGFSLHLQDQSLSSLRIQVRGDSARHRVSEGEQNSFPNVLYRSMFKVRSIDYKKRHWRFL